MAVNYSSPQTKAHMTDAGKIGLYGQIGSAVINIFSAFGAARHANEMAQIEQRIAQINEQRYRMQAQSALAASNREISTITQRYGQMKSTQRNAMAANGIALGFGSSKEVLATTDLYKQMDRNQAYANGINAALGYMSRSTAQYQASVAAAAGRTSAGTAGVQSLLGSIANIGSYVADNTYFTETDESIQTYEV